MWRRLRRGRQLARAAAAAVLRPRRARRRLLALRSPAPAAVRAVAARRRSGAQRRRRRRPSRPSQSVGLQPRERERGSEQSAPSRREGSEGRWVAPCARAAGRAQHARGASPLPAASPFLASLCFLFFPRARTRIPHDSVATGGGPVRKPRRGGPWYGNLGAVFEGCHW